MTLRINAFTVAAAISAGCALLAQAGPAQAQGKYPTRPIEMIVPSPIGGGTDLLARLIAEEIEPFLGQKLVVVNRPGAAATLGVAQLTLARPDGYTIGAVWNSPITVVPHTLTVPYTPDSYTPVAQLTSGPEGFCARSDFPANNGVELIAHLKANPEKYTYGNDGVGGKMQLASERVFRRVGVTVRAVPFGGGGETMRNLLGGHVDFYTGSVTVAMPHITAGKVKCLFVFGAKGSPAVPQASSLTDMGVPEEETLLWRGIIAPNGVSPEIVSTLEKAFAAAMERPKVKAFVEKAGEEVAFRPGSELGKLIRSEFKALGEVAKSLNLSQ